MRTEFMLHPHLPSAVDHETAEALWVINPARLAYIHDEASAWCEWMDRIDAGITSLIGRTEFRIGFYPDQLIVRAAHTRVAAELARRQ